MSAKKRKKKWKPSCGTPAGYERHLRDHERPCKHCLIGSDTYSEVEIGALIQEFDTWTREHYLWRTYQLSLDRFAEIFDAQENRCACCSTTDPGGPSWHIDHDHETNAIRGILCTNCNTGIGQLGDDLEGVQRAVAYLQAHQVRGGHARAQVPPDQQSPHPKSSAVMQRCFKLFKQAVPRNQVVVIMRLTPAAVDEIYAVWSAYGGEVVRSDKHVFQIPKDPPQRFTCSCGYAVPWTEPSEMSEAIDRVNAHITEANADHAAEWLALKTEEHDLRLEEERRRKDEQRRIAIEQLRESK